MNLLTPSPEESVNPDSQEALSGITLFRFAHIFRSASAGGVESYLGDLNRRLLERNRMRILQMYLTPDDNALQIETEQVGRGKLIWIPSLLMTKPKESADRGRHLWRKLTRRFADEPMVRHNLLLSTLRAFEVDLGVFHWLSPDANVVRDHFMKAGTPFAVVNHFENSRLRQRRIRRQISGAKAVAGVSGVAVPKFLRSNFTNLSDGIATDFFCPTKAVPWSVDSMRPVILLPARIDEGKGHVDAIRALGWLKRDGVEATLVCAGKIQSETLMSRVRRLIDCEQLADRVMFVGELTPEDLRNWYGLSALVLLPSGSEGLPRILLEAQAMQKPVLTYASGGAVEALLNGGSGYVVRKTDIFALVRCLKQLIEDVELRHLLGQNGRRFVEQHFSLQDLVIRHETFYLNTLQS
jgi:glycosyltransferase involved in cell wall biosynthesis